MFNFFDSGFALTRKAGGIASPQRLSDLMSQSPHYFILDYPSGSLKKCLSHVEVGEFLFTQCLALMCKVIFHFL